MVGSGGEVPRFLSECNGTQVDADNKVIRFRRGCSFFPMGIHFRVR